MAEAPCMDDAPAGSWAVQPQVAVSHPTIASGEARLRAHPVRDMATSHPSGYHESDYRVGFSIKIASAFERKAPCSGNAQRPLASDRSRKPNTSLPHWRCSYRQPRAPRPVLRRPQDKSSIRVAASVGPIPLTKLVPARLRNHRPRASKTAGSGCFGPLQASVRAVRVSDPRIGRLARMQPRRAHSCPAPRQEA